MSNPVPRQPVFARAGTHLDHRFCQPVHVRAFKGTGTRVVATYDTRQRVLQTGGEFANFIYHREGLITLPVAAYEAGQIGGAKRYEWIDHELNQVYTCTAENAAKYGRYYSNRMGKRWGVPVTACDLLDADGVVLQPRSLE